MRRATRVLITVGILCAGTAGCGDEQARLLEQPASSDAKAPDAQAPTNTVAELAAFFAPIGFGVAPETITHYDTLVEMTRGASVVVRGTISEVGSTRVIEDGLPGGGYPYSAVFVEPVEVLCGTLPEQFAQIIPVEFGLGSSAVAAMNKSIPAGEQVWFLHRKFGNRDPATLVHPEERNFYRLDSPQGLFIDTPTGPVNPVGRNNYTQNGFYSDSLLSGTREKIFDPVLRQARDFTSISELASEVRRIC